MVEYTHTTKLFSFSLLRVRKKTAADRAAIFLPKIRNLKTIWFLYQKVI